MNLRRTKIVVTMGPSLAKPDELERTMRAGADVFRMNFSHGTKEQHTKNFHLVRETAKKLNREVAILSDLQGPKIRVARFKDGKVLLQQGADFLLDIDLDTDAGDEHQVGVAYKQLAQDVAQDDILLLDDGRIVFKVKRIEGNKVFCEVIVGGPLSNNKGINKKGGGLTAPALTEKDKADLKTAVALDTDYICVSFPRNAADINQARELLKEAGSNAGIIAKIERAEAVPAIDEIIEASDAVMVARGDLAIEIGDAEVPAVQKHIIERARALNKAAITATQMMESMVESTVPTRAEVSDVANAVLDGTDAIMLSEESAIGKHPHIVVEAMVRVCLAVERQPETRISEHRIETNFERVDETIAMATIYVANHLHIKAIIALTESGRTPLWMSRIRTSIPIYALTDNIKTRRKMALYRDVHAVAFDQIAASEKDDDVSLPAIEKLKAMDIVHAGDHVAMTRGNELGTHGGTNSLRIHTVT
jgi:pyruvate kinase